VRGLLLVDAGGSPAGSKPAGEPPASTSNTSLHPPLAPPRRQPPPADRLPAVADGPQGPERGPAAAAAPGEIAPAAVERRRLRVFVVRFQDGYLGLVLVPHQHPARPRVGAILDVIA